MWPFRPKELSDPPRAKEPESIMLYSGDDLLERARKITWCLGYRGAVGDVVLDIYDILKKYDDLDHGVLSDPPPVEKPKLTVVE